ncbi:hypothetical protein JQ597_04500 [Bradyrhizobium sp. AUGA SZCCT0177]|uniref:P-loop NTPase fold protein n=1 Tax=Bradyrhizobium sp. AUGA SZCCT0177 TaxID=2807665 RepID=UPI001BAC8BEA|nr:P-loop NTPase fold protein [Bradyrhizobium sp. AUGA SZCCT0177]MBR1281295.1 hypothetical protein [Bradyrhizobium sp. AUGA SZCCT0177]
MVDLGGPNFVVVTREILGKAQISGIQFTDLAARLIVETVRCLKYKRAHVDELSSTSFVLTTFLYLRATNEKSKELDDLRAAMASAGLTEVDLEEMLDGFFSERPPLPAETPDEYDQEAGFNVTLGPGFRQVLRGSPSGEPLSANALLRSLLEDKDTGIFKRVRELQEAKKGMTVHFSDGGDEASVELEQPPSDPVVDAPRPPEPVAGSLPARRHVRMTREAKLEELALNVEDYAKALATILRVSEGEFSFALFGKWGSGKTTLLRPLKPLLEDPAEYRKNVVVPKGEAYADLRYRVVVHNAWKYRSPPEAWVYLYKSLATAVAATAGPLERWAIALRVATDRNGFIALLASLVAVAFALVPIQAKLQLLSLLSSAVGISAIIYLAAIWMGASSKVRQLFHRNLRLVGRDENLGMLALIGDDVRSLMKGWTKERGPSLTWRKLTVPIACVALVATTWAVALWRGSPFDLSTIARYLGLSWEAPSGHSSVDATHWLVLMIWTAFALFLVILPKFARERRPDKILLVVDDLDRCTPTEMLSVIENVRLLLDDDEINSRLQVLMLVDEDVLNHAIASRYETMIADRAKGSSGAPLADVKNDIVSEQIEKLFACHLRFSHLSDKNVEELVTKLASYENEQLRKESEELRRAETDKLIKEGERNLREATEQEASAQRLHDDVAAGKLIRRIDEDGPSIRQPRTADRMRMGDYRPMGLEEQRQARSKNERIDTTNREIASMTEEQRLAQRPDAIKALENARQKKEVSQRDLDALARNPIEPAPKPSEAPFETGDVRFSDEEVEKLRGFMPYYFRAMKRRPSPRSIKAFLFKLQLARLLMQLRYPNLQDEGARMDELLKAFQTEAVASSEEESRSDYALIVRQVL